MKSESAVIDLRFEAHKYDLCGHFADVCAYTKGVAESFPSQKRHKLASHRILKGGHGRHKT